MQKSCLHGAPAKLQLKESYGIFRVGQLPSLLTTLDFCILSKVTRQ